MSKDNPQLEDGYIQINNDLFKAVYSADFYASELKIVLFVIYQTYGYNHKTRYMTASYISNGTGIPFSTVQKVIPKLKKSNVLIERLSKGKIEIGINKHFREWKYTSTDGTAVDGVKHFRGRKSDTSTDGRQYNTDKYNTDNTKQNFFEKPSLFLCEEFARSEGLKTDAEAFYLYNEGRGWKGVEDWKPMLRLWAKNNPLKDSNSDGTTIGSIKPWRETDGTEWQ